MRVSRGIDRCWRARGGGGPAAEPTADESAALFLATASPEQLADVRRTVGMFVSERPELARLANDPISFHAAMQKLFDVAGKAPNEKLIALTRMIIVKDFGATLTALPPPGRPAVRRLD